MIIIAAVIIINIVVVFSNSISSIKPDSSKSSTFMVVKVKDCLL